MIFALSSGVAAAGGFSAAASFGLAKGNGDAAVVFLLSACVNAFAVWAMFGVPQIQAYWATVRADGDA